MLLIAGVAAIITAAPITGGDVESLEKIWAGVRDSTEEVYINSDPNVPAWGEGAERRVRTVVEPVDATWLGQNVLYLEEFLHDDPESIRRQLLLDLQPAEPPAVGVHVRMYSFKEPPRWVHLNRRPKLLTNLRRSDVVKAEGCDLMLKSEGEQFSGGTVGRGCIDIQDGGRRYVEYRLVIGEDLYWYRRRVLLRKGNDLQEEVFGFNFFELNDARLFACRVDWSSTGRKSDLRPLVRLDLHDQGGRAHFATPDGRKLELTLHSQDWPFMADRDALILLLQDQVQNVPLASAWAEIDSDDIAINLGWLRIRCGSMVSNSDALWASVPRFLQQRINVPQQYRVELVGNFHHQEVTRVRNDVGFEVRQ
jgi:hypothetical protein